MWKLDTPQLDTQQLDTPQLDGHTWPLDMPAALG